MSENTRWADLVGIAFEPLREFLSAPNVVEICVNEPGSLFIETSDGGQHSPMVQHALPGLTRERIRFMAERIAAANHQFVNEEEPLLSAALANGARIQVALPPAAPDGGVIVIRRQVVKNLALSDYTTAGSLQSVQITAGTDALTDIEAEMCDLLGQGKIETFLIAAVRQRISILVSGGTGSGKTTFLNALMREIPTHERLITIEDTPELMPTQPNHVRLISSRGDQNIAKIDSKRLVEASMRMRPDRLLLGEIRGAESFDFLQAINTGHPGSLSTVHANSPRGAYERLALLMIQDIGGGGTLTRADILQMLKSTLPLVVQVARSDGQPGRVMELYYEPFVRARHAGRAGSRQPSDWCSAHASGGDEFRTRNKSWA
ncbi:P-type DNA transfer ATPase VirB11 [Labrys sp. 22185]|uniref:P-type DNA transfer ATPase VirB11 n=1 Tax=Labrys sp. 22185 TaxID=3453888 RepID=UPI003F825D18